MNFSTRMGMYGVALSKKTLRWWLKKFIFATK